MTCASCSVKVSFGVPFFVCFCSFLLVFVSFCLLANFCPSFRCALFCCVLCCVCSQCEGEIRAQFCLFLLCFVCIGILFVLLIFTPQIGLQCFVERCNVRFVMQVSV